MENESKTTADLGMYSKMCLPKTGIAYKITWLLLIVVSWSLCTYQIADRFMVYYSYPIGTLVKRLDASSMQLPNITICGDLDGGTLAMRRFLQKFWPKTNNPGNCVTSRSRTFWDIIDVMDIMPHELWQLSDIGDDLNLTHQLVSKDGTIVNIEGIKVKTVYGTCTMFSFRDAASFASLASLVLTINGDERTNCSKPPRILVHNGRLESLHKPMIIDGLEIAFSIESHLVISLKQFNHLNHSKQICVETKIHDECNYQCITRSLEGKVNCRLPFMTDNLGVKLPDCNTSEDSTNAFGSVFHKYERFRFTNCGCPRPCVENLYTYYWLFGGTNTPNRTNIGIQVFDRHVKIVTEFLMYDFVSLLCDAGGHLGLFVGFCLLSFIDVLEVLSNVMCRTYQNSRTNQKDTKLLLLKRNKDMLHIESISVKTKKKRVHKKIK